MRKIVCLLMLSTLLIGCSNSQKEGNNTSKINESISTTIVQETASSDDFEYETEQEEVILTYKDEEVAKAYREVLKSERSFISTDENNEETYLDEFDYIGGEQAKKIQVIGFSFFDINGDGNYEISVSILANEKNTQIENELLYYVDGTVYGYQLPEYMSLRGDNVIYWDNIGITDSDSRVYSGYARIQLNNEEISYTYVFENTGSDDEKWIKESGLIREMDCIDYIGDEYSKYVHSDFAYDKYCSISDGNGYREIDKNIIYKTEPKKENVIGHSDMDIPKTYREVLKSERSFISIDEDNEETYLKEFDYIAGIDCISTDVSRIKVADIGDDDNYEVVLEIWGEKRYPKDEHDDSERVVEILSYEDGVVYGYQLPMWMFVIGDSVVSWNNIGMPGYVVGDTLIEGYAIIKIDNKELIYTYFFEKEGSKEEEWLRKSGVLSDKDNIIYVGKKYDKYIFSGYKYNVSIDGYIDEEDIDGYIR